MQSSTNMRHFIITGVLVVITTFLLDALLSAALPLPLQASIEALTIDAMIGWHVLLIAFLFALVFVFMIYAIIVFRKREGDDEEGEHFHGHLGLEVGWTVAPVILVLIFCVYGVQSLNEITKVEENEMVVTATGFQWAWSFEYPVGEDESFIDTTLVLPVNANILMELESTDVLHSFWVPEFRVKQDLVPGQTTNLRFTPSVPGEYKLRCAELCGLTHWNMLATVLVLEQAEYDDWYSQKLAENNINVETLASK
ncbi:MAG: cytochrome c oxidase subunit II [Chloroflexota bacterium]